MAEDKFQNKYRIPSTRLQNWDYRWNGAYFITICTKDRIHYFGEITNGKMVLSNIGVLADVFWHEIKNHTKNVTVGQFVVMPNHIHGILILDGNYNDNDGNGIGDGNCNDNDNDNDNGNDNGNCNDNGVETRHALSLQSNQSNESDQSNHPSDESNESNKSNQSNKSENHQKSIGQKRFQNQGKNSLSSIVGGYKSAVTKHAKRLGFDFGWQTRFHDHIIRDEKTFETISHYIKNNPANWDKDKFQKKD